MRDDDAFWAARRVMAFSDDADSRGGEDRAVQRSEGGAVPRRRADQAARQDRPRLPARRSTRSSIPALDAAGVLTFGNAAVRTGFATAPAGYRGRVVRVRQRDRRFAPDRADDRRPGSDCSRRRGCRARPAHTSASISRPITRSIRAGSSRSGPRSSGRPPAGSSSASSGRARRSNADTARVRPSGQRHGALYAALPHPLRGARLQPCKSPRAQAGLKACPT